MIYLGWLGVIVWRSCVGESGAQLRCLRSASAWADADSLVKWWK